MRILIVDDEESIRTSLSGILSDEGYHVDVVESGEAALAALETRRYDLLLLDVWLPGIDGIETLQRLRALDAEVPVVVISGHGTIETAVRAVRLGAQDFVEKPLSLEKTLLAVRNALRQRHLRNTAPLARVQYDSALHPVHGTLGSNAFVSRVQGGKLKRKNEIRIATLFREAPPGHLRMVVVHELAHLKVKDHDKAFYQLCTHMAPDYHQLEFDLRLYLTQLDLERAGPATKT